MEPLLVPQMDETIQYNATHLRSIPLTVALKSIIVDHNLKDSNRFSFVLTFFYIMAQNHSDFNTLYRCGICEA